MRARPVFIALALAALAVLGARAQDMVLGGSGSGAYAPRDIWPQATALAREGDFDAAGKKTAELINTGRTNGLKTFPQYAASASALSGQSARETPELAKWAATAAAQLDGNSPAVVFGQADRAAQNNQWSTALSLATKGYARMFRNYRTRVLARSDMLLMVALAIFVTAAVFAVALFFRYGRSMAHDFREMLSNLITGGSVSVLAFALLFLPIFLWLGPIWLLFYWLAIFFGYAGGLERFFIVLLLILVAFLPVAVNALSEWISGVDSPVMMAAISSANQSYEPAALRRLQELIAVVPENAMLNVLLGNIQAYEGLDDQAAQHYKRATELRRNYAGAHVNRGNLYFLNNEFQAAITEYEKAERADPNLAIAYYNHSVAAGETYKFDQQKEMLAKARQADQGYVDRLSPSTLPQKVVMYHPPISEAWAVTRSVAKRTEASRGLFGNYFMLDPTITSTNPITVGAVLALVFGVLIWMKRRKNGFANACIKCGRTFCHRCKSARESATYCTQCIHIYLKRDGVSLDTKRQKLEEVSSNQTGVVRRNRIFTTFLPGSGQLMEGRTLSGILGIFFFALFVATAIFTGRLAPALGPVAEVAQLIVRVGAIVLAVILWLVMSLPVYRRRMAV